jgi:hypothetical protein
MRYDILENIKPEEGQTLDNLAQLFNAYMGRLSMLESSVFPRESMREFQRLWSAQPTPRHNKQERESAKHLASFIPRFYHLQILSNSLCQLHRNVNGAIEKLAAFFETYGGDLKRYAIENRLHCIEEYGSDENSDWYRENEADENEPWKVVYKEDEQALDSYTLAADLAQFFEGADWRGEHIGTSGVEDFAQFTAMVARNASFNPFKAIAAFTGTELPIYRTNEQGEMVPQSLAEQAENEMNDELRDVRVACYFDQILRRLEQAASCHKAAHATEDYSTLLGQLESIRDCAGLLEPASPFND